jgi:hypothetical protein
MIPIGPEQREDHSVHDEIAEKGEEEEEHEGASMPITQPAHGSPFRESKPSKVFSVVLVYDRTIGIAIKRKVALAARQRK